MKCSLARCPCACRWLYAAEERTNGVYEGYLGRRLVAVHGRWWRGGYKSESPSSGVRSPSVRQTRESETSPKRGLSAPKMGTQTYISQMNLLNKYMMRVVRGRSAPSTASWLDLRRKDLRCNEMRVEHLGRTSNPRQSRQAQSPNARGRKDALIPESGASAAWRAHPVQ